MKMLTVKAAAARAGVSAGLVYAWVASGILSHFRVGRPGTRGSIRIDEVDLDAFMASLKQGGRQPEPPPAPAPKPKAAFKHLRLT